MSDSDDSAATTPRGPDTPSATDLTLVMVQMQQQQIEMQKQMAVLMTQLRPKTPAVNSRAKLTRPIIDADTSDNRWVIFKDEWQRYKEMAKLSNPPDIRNELRAACSRKVNEMLFNFVGPDDLQTASEDQLLGFIKSVAVKAVHPEVYRQHFSKLQQSDGETITSFISRLKAQAMLCAFHCKGKCGGPTCTPSYAQDMIRSQLITGMRNSSHQAKVLSEMATLVTLDQLTTRLLTLEATEHASTEFRSPHDTQTVADITPINSFKPGYNKPSYGNNQRTTNRPCNGCGNRQHLPDGRSSCPAWGKVCRKCKKPNHFTSVCRSNKAAAIQEQFEEEPPLISSIAAPL